MVMGILRYTHKVPYSLIKMGYSIIVSTEDIL